MICAVFLPNAGGLNFRLLSKTCANAGLAFRQARFFETSNFETQTRKNGLQPAADLTGQPAANTAHKGFLQELFPAKIPLNMFARTAERTRCAAVPHPRRYHFISSLTF